MPSDNYVGLKEDVHSFIKNFQQHIRADNLPEIENDYSVKFPKLTEQYFPNTKWPSADVVSQVVGKDSPHPVKLVLPNQWLWDIIDEFLYQFHKFKAFRHRQKHKPEDEAALEKYPKVWSIHCVLNVLYSLVKKSAINEQLSYYAKQGDPDEIADEFGRSPLYKMLGFFSLIGLCRIHCLMADYNSAIKALENIKFSRVEMYHDVFTCHIATGYYLGLSFMMMRRYMDAIRTFSVTLAYKNRGISLAIGQRSDLRDYVNKQADQMSCLMALCSTFCPISSSVDHPLDLDRRDKYGETMHQLQHLEESEFALTFDYGCPKYISVDTSSMDPGRPGDADDSAVVPADPQRQQAELFKAECHQQIDLLRLRSFLKLYTSIPVAKLAKHLNCTETDIHVSLMAYKFRMKQVTALMMQSPQTATASSAHPDLDFYIDDSIVHIADTTVDRRFSEYFVRHIEMLQHMNNTLDTLERRLHDTPASQATA